MTDWSTVAAPKRISPDDPGRKVNEVRRLKIQLGLGCNYSCGYCLQSSEIHQAGKSSTQDGKNFLDGLDTWFREPKGGLERLEFWGGEPLLYWSKIIQMAPVLRARFPDTKFTMITNGSLLTPDKVDLLDEWNFSVGMSHDGPGQHVRGPDPLQDLDICEGVFYALEKLGPKRFGFNAVISPASYDVCETIDWFHTRFDPCVSVGFEGVVHDYGGDASGVFTEEKLAEFSELLTNQIIFGGALRSPSIDSKLRETIKAILGERPSYVLGQKCGMDEEDFLAVDLLGNVTTCQNTGGEGEHKIGHVSEMSEVRLHTSTHWSHRRECVACPVLQQCQGSCMYQTGAGWVNSCNAEFAYNSAFLKSALYFLTGALPVSCEGDFVRPTLGE